MNFISALLDILIVVASIVLIFLGSTKKDEYNFEKSAKLKLLVLGVILLVLYLVINIPEMYNGVIDGFNANR